MNKELSNNIKLGIFVIAGLVSLILGLYLIGINNALFGSNITVKARFRGINGLTVGNNVRFSGIQTGSIKKIEIINDTTIDVYMLVSTKMKPFIHKNSIAQINSDGLMGNKMIDISPNPETAPIIEEGDMLISKEDFNTGAMLETLNQTNQNASVISNELIITIKRLNNNRALWNLLEDTSVTNGLKTTIKNIRIASQDMDKTMTDLHEIVANIKKGDGIAGTLLVDKNANDNLKSTLKNANLAAENTQRLIARLDSISKDLHHQLVHGQGAIPQLLSDRETSERLKTSLLNLEQGTATFKQDMDALKQNKFIKRYLRKEAQQNKNNTQK